MYSEYASSFTGATLWSVTGAGQSTVVPDGCVDIIWMQGELLAIGPMTRPITTPALSEMAVGLRFHPGVAPRVLGVSAGELTDDRLALDDIMPSKSVRQATERLLCSTSVSEKSSVIESLVARRATTFHPAVRQHDTAEQVLALVRSGMPVHQISAELHLSERQLHRHSTDAFGYGLRTLGRILRFNGAMRMLNMGAPPAVVASANGYADQPHFTREFLTFAGTTPGKYRSQTIS